MFGLVGQFQVLRAETCPSLLSNAFGSSNWTQAAAKTSLVRTAEGMRFTCSSSSTGNPVFD